VGLGGRLDAVNLFNANLCAITSISLDHQEILGRTLSEIFQEKVGIARQGIPLVSCLEQKEVQSLLEQKAEALDFPFFDLYKENLVTNEDNYRQKNRKLAQVIFNIFKHKDPRGSIDKVVFPKALKGRFEVMTLRSKRFIFIGAHNVDGWEKLRSALLAEDLGFIDKALISFSVRPNNEILEGLKIMHGWKDFIKKILFTSFEHPKAAEPEIIKSLVNKSGHEEGLFYFVENWQEHLFKETKDKQPENILVIGSYYFIGEVQKYLLTT